MVDVMSNLETLEKTLGNKKTKEALSKSLSWTFWVWLKELWNSLRKVFTSDSSISKWYSKNQITKDLEKIEKKRIKLRSLKKAS